MYVSTAMSRLSGSALDAARSFSANSSDEFKSGARKVMVTALLLLSTLVRDVGAAPRAIWAKQPRLACTPRRRGLFRSEGLSAVFIAIPRCPAMSANRVPAWPYLANGDVHVKYLVPCHLGRAVLASSVPPSGLKHAILRPAPVVSRGGTDDKHVDCT